MHGAIPAAAERAGRRVRVEVDYDLCQGHGTCANEAPEVFAVDPATQQVRVLEDEPPEAQADRVRAAVRYCPTMALRLVED